MMKTTRSYIILLVLPLVSLMGTTKAFEPTKPGTIEIKTIPAGVLLESTSEKSYFSQSNGLFMPLFRYIQKKDISMTTPVEARINPGKMYFWVDPSQLEKADESTDAVTVIQMPSRLVASIGESGSYSEENYLDAKNRLMQWIHGQNEIEAIGEPFGVYWDGPVTPWFLKKFEVQVEVRKQT